MTGPSPYVSLPPPPLQPRIPRPPIRIIVLCDGTAQQRNWVKMAVGEDEAAVQDGNFFTNVALLAKAIQHSSGLSASPPTSPPQSPRNGASTETNASQEASANATLNGGNSGGVMSQVVFYQSGVGTGSSFFTNMIEQGTGNSLGHKIEEAYSFISDNYQPGDELFLFGFSRGAYTARCISGLINWCGILDKVEMSHFAAIWNAYQSRDPDDITTDDKAAEVLFNRTGKYPSVESELTATNMLLFNLSQDKKLTPAQRLEAQQKREKLCGDRSNKVVPPQIKVVGVWDTVSALGLPGMFQNNAWIDFYDFYDPGLGSNIQFAFHALSLEEDRKDFLPTMWYQPPQEPDAHANHVHASGVHMRRKQVLKQCWFQGVHTDCGGGYQYHGLSDVSLIWMVSQLVDPHILPDGSTTLRPLLNIDIALIESILDRRRRWGCQIPHRSRPVVNFQAPRIVCQRRWNKAIMRRTVWANMAQTGRTFESIHPSVVAGGRVRPDTHPAFEQLRDDQPSKLQEMWRMAEDMDSALRPTEKYLYWSKPMPYPAPAYDPRNPSNPQQGGWNIHLDPRDTTTYLKPNPEDGGGDDEAEPVTVVAATPFLPSLELGENPVDAQAHPGFARFWASVWSATFIPTTIIPDLMNLEFVPTNNLRLTALQKLWWKFGDKVAGYDEEVKQLFRGFDSPVHTAKPVLKKKSAKPSNGDQLDS
ncbi:hypothetical protein BCV70DRAFT_184479 [Testicularia cyperi]|uniref:T6SS Phospholipase effector Tle1-like catalytic domain-containing protein n=1 Tax=Testicularia cyperi TaxID=1882483 RepID=A0A317XZC6_9BASI|nr:hypothetical protein BCV70DRAFT_184479 [Testicularia cyperi]